jgi:hypothetical protein
MLPMIMLLLLLLLSSSPLLIRGDPYPSYYFYVYCILNYDCLDVVKLTSVWWFHDVGLLSTWRFYVCGPPMIYDKTQP